MYVLSHFIESVMNFIVLFTYSDPCKCLIQIWLVYLIRMPAYFYYLGSPLFHFAIMIERVLATVYVKIYENQGKLFSVICTIVVWTINLIYGVYIYITTQMDTDTFSHPMVYLTLTTNYNSQILIYLNFFYLFLVICIAIADYYLILRNQKIKLNFFKSTLNYSLSKSYQAKQNILLMKIIFPLDFSYSFVYALFNIMASILRYNREEYGPLFYVRTYDGIALVNKSL
uniref:Serpentine receptor class gamma n=1 Tax=Meloidogyne incognita TaxID=6306 RepID=A0A914LBH7_MELIC